MGEVVLFKRRRGHVRASGQMSGRKSERETPVSRSMSNTRSAGTPFLERISQYQTCDWVTLIRLARRFCPPAASIARLSPSDMDPTYPYLGKNQPTNLSGTEYPKFGSFAVMKRPGDAKKLGARVRALRDGLNMTQKQLAKAAGMSQQNIVNIEKGAVERPRRLKELAIALETTQEALLGEEAVDPQPATKDEPLAFIRRVWPILPDAIKLRIVGGVAAEVVKMKQDKPA